MFANQCGHCKKLEPTWNKLPAVFLQNGLTISVGKVDITQQKGDP